MSVANLSVEPIFSSLADQHFSGAEADYRNINHRNAFELNKGTISLSFSIDRVQDDYALIGKDNSGENAGDFTVWIENGIIKVKQESNGDTEYLEVPDIVLDAHTTYHFALSFGSDGLSIWLNGTLVAAEPEFKQGMQNNNADLVLGGTRAWRDNDNSDAHSLFKGSIGDVMIFDKQLDSEDMRALAADVDPSLGMEAEMSANMERLAPVFQQLHGASDTFLDILSDYGVTHHGHLHRSLNMIQRNNGANDLKGTAGDDGIDSGNGNDKIRAAAGDDVIQGGYGNDKIWGGGGNDVLDGGHGEDILRGGNGADLLISRADAREPDIAFDPDRDEGDPYNELTNGKLYPDQPLHADDRLYGDAGADIFYFQTLINAKERYIEEHTRDDGTINWHGVAGENDKLHDHWVDALGNDQVMDYSKAEGDRIVIEGHTTEIDSITYGDSNGDGVIDHSIIALYSDQGNGGGAHNDDLLGTITVFGDLVTMGDIEQTAAPAYGIVEGVWDIDEAITPRNNGTNAVGAAAPNSGLLDSSSLDLNTTRTPVFAVVGDYAFVNDEREAMIFDHSDSIDLKNGTIAFSFTSNSLSNNQGLFSKDAKDLGAGGHITAYVNKSGSLVVRVQSDAASSYFVADNIIEVGKEYDFALTFGNDGIELYLNGALIAYDVENTVNWSKNEEAFILGAAGWNNTPGTTNNINSYFDGDVSNLMIFDRQMTSEQIFGSDERSDFIYFDDTIDAFEFVNNGNGTIGINGNGSDETVGTDIEFLQFEDVAVRKSDIQFGSDGIDNMYGGDGADVLLGGRRSDVLKGHGNNDLLDGGGAADELFGGDGSDKLIGGNGDDRIFGGDEKDELFGGRDEDKLFGGADIDKLYGGNGNDELYGGRGNDKFYAGLGDDRLFGNEWNAGGSNSNDRAYFDGEFSDFTFESNSYYDNNRGETVTRLYVTDHASGGSDGFYEGRDTLVDIDVLVFADQTVLFEDLI